MKADKPSRKTGTGTAGGQVINQARHEAHCTVCAHPERAEIEQAFVNWVSPVRIATQFMVSSDAVYRHAQAMQLMDKRRRNIRAALERIIEKAGEVEVNAAAVVSAISTYARINARGEFVERSETVNLNALFERMSTAELEAYARNGELPAWFTGVLGAAAGHDSEGENEG
jgi:hypothetical protein